MAATHQAHKAPGGPATSGAAAMRTAAGRRHGRQHGQKACCQIKVRTAWQHLNRVASITEARAQARCVARAVLRVGAGSERKFAIAAACALLMPSFSPAHANVLAGTAVTAVE